MWGKLLAWPACVLLLCPASAPAISAGLDFNFPAGIESQWSGASLKRPILLSPAPPRPPEHLWRVQAQPPETAPTPLPDALTKAESEKRWGDAELLYRDLLAKEPGRVDLLLRLVDTLAAQDKRPEAAEALAKAADLRRDDAELQLRASEAFGAADRPA